MMETFNLIYHLIFRFYNVAFFFFEKKKKNISAQIFGPINIFNVSHFS